MKRTNNPSAIRTVNCNAQKEADTMNKDFTTMMNALNKPISQNDRNVIYVFGMPSRVGTASNLILVSYLVNEAMESFRLYGLSQTVLGMTDEDWQDTFHTIKYRKETILNHLVSEYQAETGDTTTARPWKSLAKKLILNKFCGIDQNGILRSLMVAEYAATEPMIKEAIHELIDEVKADNIDGLSYCDALEAGEELVDLHFMADDALYESIAEEDFEPLEPKITQRSKAHKPAKKRFS